MNPYANRWPTDWYQGQYNPHVYVPPSYYNQPYQPTGWHGLNFDRSAPKSKWPSLNPILASDMTYVRYDIRKPAQEGIMLSTWQQISHVPAFVAPTYEILIISKAFPWSIVIRAPAGSVITCGAIFEGLHELLQKHIEDSEWAIVALDKTRREAIEKAAKSRQEKDKSDKRLKRIDWLGDTPMFKGLEKDEEFGKKRHLPGSASIAETWVVRFGKP